MKNSAKLSPACRRTMPFLLLAGLGCSAEVEVGLDQALSRIDPDLVRSHVEFLSHDSLRGRDTDDIGYEIARDYVAREFGRIGLTPMEGESYLQPFDLLEVVADEGSELRVGSTVLTYPHAMFTPDWLGDRPVVAAEGVFVGHGLVTGDIGAGAVSGLTGKVAFVMAGPPAGRADEPDVAMRDRAVVELAYRAGAVAVVVLDASASEAAWQRRVQTRRPVRVLADGSAPAHRPAAMIGPLASQALLAEWTTGISGTIEPARNIGDVTLRPAHGTRQVRSWNVGGILPGEDPALGDQVVVFTAHLDHVGVGSPDASGDSIFNGTHDNALGVAKVLAAAEALSGMALRRSVLFLTVGAEESGLLGSWYYLKNPAFPVAKTAAMINHDGGLIGPRTDDVLAWGPEFSNVAEDLEWAAAETGMVFNRERRAPFTPSAGLLYRSDHYPFLIAGVPAVYLMPGFSIGGDPNRGQRAWLDYLATVHHAQADNVVPGAPYDSPVALTALSVRLAWRLANADEMPMTLPTAPISRRRKTPDGYFFGDSLSATLGTSLNPKPN